MKRDTLTKTERRIVAAWKAAGLPAIADTAALRGMMRCKAYHEAGHAAAHAFIGDDASHAALLTIIPTGRCAGLHCVADAMPDGYFRSYPPPLARVLGRHQLLYLLAGNGAEIRVANKAAFCDEGDAEGGDRFRALRIADLLARPGWPAWRVLDTAALWTAEMLALPDVWRTVETLAGMLLDRGTIESAEIMPACDGIRYASMTLPKWRRRLHDMGDNTGRTRRKDKAR